MPPSLHVLILEDDLNDAMLMIAALEKARYSYEWERIETREEFLVRLNTPDYDIILSDYNLPGFGGLAALKLLLERDLDIPFILVSGVIGEELATESLKAGATDYVLKDHLSRLGPVVARALQEKEERRQRKQAEESLRQSQQNYDALVNSIDGIVWEADAETIDFSFVSKQVERLLGYPAEQWLADSEFWANHIHPEDREWAVSFCTQATAEKRNHEFEYRMIAADGRVVWLRDIVTVVVEDDQPVALRGVMIDITERKQAEAALRSAETRYRDLFENASDIIYTHDLQGNISSVNKVSERLTGYSRKEAIGMNFAEIVAPEYRELALENISRKILKETHSTTYELEIIRKDGSRLPLEVSSQLIYEGDRPVAVQGSARDISERKQAEAEQQQLREQLLQAQKMESIGRLASGVAHDFNNLLTAIIGYSQLVLGRIGPNDSMRKAAEEIVKAGQRAAELTGQLLIFSRRQKLERKTVNINHTIGNLIKMLRRIIGEDVEVKVKPHSDLLPVYADPTQIEQVIMNLAVNARDAMPGGGRLIIETRNVTLDEAYCRERLWARPGDYAQIIISDTGTGMDSDTLQQIFEPFFTTKEIGKGTGLGLAVVYGIVRRHDGLISVHSRVGQGTTFKVYLPVQQEVMPQEILEPQSLLRGGSETILVAEDDENLRKMALNILEGLGYRVLLASDGQEAVHIYESNREQIDLVILDMIMPRMGGHEARRQIELVGGDVPVLFMTGYSSEFIQNRLTETTDGIVIQKPYGISELDLKVREALDRQPVGKGMKSGS